MHYLQSKHLIDLSNITTHPINTPDQHSPLTHPTNTLTPHTLTPYSHIYTYHNRSAVHYLQSKHLIDLSNITTLLLPQVPHPSIVLPCTVMFVVRYRHTCTLSHSHFSTFTLTPLPSGTASMHEKRMEKC